MCGERWAFENILSNNMRRNCIRIIISGENSRGRHNMTSNCFHLVVEISFWDTIRRSRFFRPPSRVVECTLFAPPARPRVAPRARALTVTCGGRAAQLSMSHPTGRLLIVALLRTGHTRALGEPPRHPVNRLGAWTCGRLPGASNYGDRAHTPDLVGSINLHGNNASACYTCRARCCCCSRAVQGGGREHPNKSVAATSHRHRPLMCVCGAHGQVSNGLGGARS